MNTSAGGPAGLMVLHLWTEPGNRMRVRVTRTVDLASGRPLTSYASEKSEVLKCVAEWLDELSPEAEGR